MLAHLSPMGRGSDSLTHTHSRVQAPDLSTPSSGSGVLLFRNNSWEPIGSLISVFSRRRSKEHKLIKDSHLALHKCGSVLMRVLEPFKNVAAQHTTGM